MSEKAKKDQEEKVDEDQVTDSDLKKSIDSLTTLLDSDAEEVYSDGSSEEDSTEDNEAEQVFEKALAVYKEAKVSLEKAKAGISSGRIGVQGGLAHLTGAEDLDDELEDDKDREVDVNLGEDSEGYRGGPAESVGGDAATSHGAQGAYAKSVADAMSEHEPLVKAVTEGNEFQKSLVMATIEASEILQEDLHKAIRASERRNKRLLAGMAKSIVTMGSAVDDIHQTMEAIGNAPVRRTPKSSKYLEKSFAGREEGARLTKAQIGEILFQKVQKKEIPVLTAIKFDSTGEIDEGLLASIEVEVSNRG